MMFKKIVDNCKKEGFSVDSSKGYFILTLKRKDNVVAEISFPFDNPKIKNGDAISWDFSFTDSESDIEIYKDWRESYGENSLVDIYEDISKFIQMVSKMEFRIIEKSILSLLKWKFGKFKQLEFNTTTGWQRF